MQIMPIIEIESESRLLQLLSESKDRPLWLFKHSTRCPTSSSAFAEYRAFAREISASSAATLAMVKVIEQRAVSDLIADMTGVAHGSPQVILVRGGAAVWNDSHFQITKASLARAMFRHASDGGIPSD